MARDRGDAWRGVSGARAVMLWALVATVAVAVTVGPLAATLVAALLLAERARAGRHVLANAAVVALLAVPVAWFAGSSLPLVPPAARLQDNDWAHQIAGVAVWLLFLAAWSDRRPSPPGGLDDTAALGVTAGNTRTTDRMTSDKDSG